MKPAIVHGKVSAALNRTVDAIRKILKKYDLKKEDLQLCYEAGPTGYVLARRLIQLGYDCQVIAPSLIPTKPRENRKTDRRYARKLAEMHAPDRKPPNLDKARSSTILYHYEIAFQNDPQGASAPIACKAISYQWFKFEL